MIHVLRTSLRKSLCLCRGFLILIYCFLLPFFLVSCASNRFSSSNTPFTSDINWQNLNNISYAQYFFYENKDFPLRCHCLKINLQDESLQFNIFPDSEKVFLDSNGSKTAYFKGLSAKEFSKKHPSKIFINTAPFSGKEGSSSFIAKLTDTRKISGIHTVNKKELSAPLKKYSALCIKKSEKGYSAKIFKNQTVSEYSGYDFCLGGFYTILTDSKKETFSYQTRDSRTAVGLSGDGKTLYILIAEGERKSQSTGLSYPECADIMLALGAKNAMEMDGGGSTTLYINGKNMLSYSSSRKIAVFFGFN
ncbi:phosphodiester glycosidase family protein [Treponema sp.]|uniref:phosphodiester glycosidase family protein n=1 Tax=Treponema sp. TaxID=166 RepID=UPI0038909AC5